MLRRWRLDLECLGSWAAPESLEIDTSPASVACPRNPAATSGFSCCAGAVREGSNGSVGAGAKSGSAEDNR
jgi:hypothetical protein